MKGFLVAAGLPLTGGGKQLGCCVPALSVTAAVRKSPSCRPAVPIMLSANCTACSWSGRLLRGGGASASTWQRVSSSYWQHAAPKVCTLSTLQPSWQQ